MRAIRNASIPLTGAIGAVVLSAALTARKRFVERLDEFDQRLADAQFVAEARTDLQPEVTELATRLVPIARPLRDSSMFVRRGQCGSSPVACHAALPRGNA